MLGLDPCSRELDGRRWRCDLKGKEKMRAFKIPHSDWEGSLSFSSLSPDVVHDGCWALKYSMLLCMRNDEAPTVLRTHEVSRHVAILISISA